MREIKRIEQITGERDKIKSDKKSIGFVPTMGALHEGHLSLIKRSLKENDVTIVSIFVNPTQFNDPEDYNKYPRDIEKDKNILLGHLSSGDILFIPYENEIYPSNEKVEFDLEGLDKIMEGKHRPGHFNGVAQVVSRLFEIVKPDKAYFGEKDYQQIKVIEKINEKGGYHVDIVSCPLIRERDGLALSSRNKLLTGEQRKNAVEISKILSQSKNLLPEKSVEELKEWVKRKIESVPLLELEYFEIVDAKTLDTIKQWNKDEEIMGCIAVKVGKIRLIDNIKYNS